MTVIDTTGISPADMPLERLEAEIAELSGHIAAASARLLMWIAEYDRREGWRTWGCASAAQWLAWKCGDGLHAAREKVRTARALESLPVLAASFAAGELSFTKVRAVTRVAVPADEHEWVEMARHSTGAQLEKSVSAARAAIARGENADARRAFERRMVTRGRRPDGQDEMKIIGPADAVEVIWAAVEVVVSQMVDEAVAGSGRTRREVMAERGGMAAMRFDALTQVAERAVASTPAAAVRGDVGRLALVIDTDGLAEIAAADDNADDAGEAEAGEITLSGRRIAPEVAKRWCCDIRASVMLEHEGHVHDEGRDTPVLNRKLRRALHRRDGGLCRFPGCGVSSWLHAHHIVHWSHDGPTDLDNLVSLCGFHHRLVHEGGWAVAIADGAVVWSDPDGVPATVEPLRGDADTLVASQQPLRITPRSIESKANDRLDFHFVVSVLAQHIARRRAVDVSAETPGNEHESGPQGCG
ncbi:MAG: DUF222 domain-containing protein [Acidimicrobiales bacterium]|nr:DUF222 domain-containing protein [Acidimicrobiales bacterium]